MSETEKPAIDGAKLLDAMEAAYHALRGYQYGNASPDLAEEIADHLAGLLRLAGRSVLDDMSPRERQLKLYIQRLNQMHQELLQPLIHELVDIENRKRPKPVVLPDGHRYEYTGPWPYDEKGEPLKP